MRAVLAAGSRKIGIEFTNDFYVENESDRTLPVEAVEVQPAK